MSIKEMTATQCREFLVPMDFGRLGCVHDNHPYVVPI
jgi:nitroimidazol reductase NimA-like FMN-containing flavoprotein (pyridoxamine 5'-phosphate oxidase superfamily)